MDPCWNFLLKMIEVKNSLKQNFQTPQKRGRVSAFCTDPFCRGKQFILDVGWRTVDSFKINNCRCLLLMFYSFFGRWLIHFTLLFGWVHVGSFECLRSKNPTLKVKIFGTKLLTKNASILSVLGDTKEGPHPRLMSVVTSEEGQMKEKEADCISMALKSRLNSFFFFFFFFFGRKPTSDPYIL